TTYESLTSDGQNLALQAYSTTVSPPDLGPASAGSDLLYVDTLNIETGGELYVTLALDGSVYMDPLNFQNGTLVTLPDIVLLQSLYSTYTTGCVPEFSV